MLKFTLLVSLAAAIAGAHIGSRIGEKIVGGVEVDIKDYPHQVSVLTFGMHKCGGTIIAADKILTVAHCTDNEPVDRMSIRTGSRTLNAGGTVVYVKEIIQHPNFKYPDYDLSILILEKELPIGQRGTNVIELAEEGGPPEAGTLVNVTGWGLTSAGGYPSKILRKIEVEVYTTDDCIKAYGNDSITDRLFCAGIHEGGIDACDGDAGGPLSSNGVLLGVTVGGFLCGERRYPSIYSSVPNMRQWIREVADV